MKRRDVITLLASAAVAWPLDVRAQPRLPVIGSLVGVSQKEWAARMDAVRRGLADAGFVEGKNVLIEYRWGEGRAELFPKLAADLVNRKVDVVFASASVAAIRVLMATTSTIPIVFTSGADPVSSGLVPSLNRPGGNVTGVTNFNGNLGPKRLELLRELLPEARRVGLLVNQNNPATERADVEQLSAAAPRLGLELTVHRGGSEQDIDTAIKTMAAQRTDAVFTGNDAFFTSRRHQISRQALDYKLPSSFSAQEGTVAGGLMSYGANVDDVYRQAGSYLGRILKGEKPGELPVIQPTRFVMVINLKTAKALGLKLSEAFLLRADEVIE